jgi:adenylate cyclase
MTTTTVTLQKIANALQGVIPSTLATCTPDDGTPNVTILSMVYYVDDTHVALTRQFFNKTAKNLEMNRSACALVYDPTDGQGYRLTLHYERSETEGATFDAMATRLAAIASHMKLTDVFRLRSADIFEVRKLEPVEGEIDHSIPLGVDMPITATADADVARSMSLTELRAVHSITSSVSVATDLDPLLSGLLSDLAQIPGLAHSSLLLADETGERLFTIASHGYEASGVGAEVVLGEGIIGTSARERRVMRVTNLDREIHYARHLDRQPSPATMEIPLPNLETVRRTARNDPGHRGEPSRDEDSRAESEA